MRDILGWIKAAPYIVAMVLGPATPYVAAFCALILIIGIAI